MGSGGRMKLGALALALAACCASPLLAAPPEAKTHTVEACRADLAQLRGDWGQARFTIELADTDAARAQGLMHRESLPQASGMLFVYESSRTVGFWMKDTLIPLDMIFLDATGTVVRVHSNAIPGDLTPIMGGNDIKAVLEINGGLARRLGIAAGSQLRHPSFTQERAAWKC